MPLYLFYTIVQKGQKWPKTQIKGGPALNRIVEKYTVLIRLRSCRGGGGGYKKERSIIRVW